MSRKRVLAYLTTLVLVASMAAVLGGSAYGDTVSNAEAAAYGVQLQGPVPISPTPSVSATAPGSEEDALIEIPASPALTSATASVVAQAERESTLDATLQATMDAQRQRLPKKWNARGYAITEDLAAAADMVTADVVESESVAACAGGDTVFGSAARIVNLSVGGTAIPVLNPTPNQVLFDQAGIRIVAWETNWDPGTGRTTDGATVFANALHITGPGGIDLIVSHSEASAACAAAQDLKECEDRRDNDGDGVIDEDDPGCHSDGDPDNPASYNPKDDDERDDRTLAGNLKRHECEDRADNDGDGVIDEDDPGCHSDGDPDNPASYNPNDDNEIDDAPAAGAIEVAPNFTG